MLFRDMGGADLIGKKRGNYIIYQELVALQLASKPMDRLTRVQVSHAVPFLDLGV